MTLDRACAAYEQPTESTHCPDLDTRGKEDQKAAEGEELLKDRGRRWVSPIGARLLPLQETEQVGRDKSMALFSQGDLGNKSSTSWQHTQFQISIMQE